MLTTNCSEPYPNQHHLHHRPSMIWLVQPRPNPRLQTSQPMTFMDCVMVQHSAKKRQFHNLHLGSWSSVHSMVATIAFHIQRAILQADPQNTQTTEIFQKLLQW